MLYPSGADILISSVYQATRAPGRPLKGGAWSVSGISPQNRDDFSDIRSCIETVDRTHLLSSGMRRSDSVQVSRDASWNRHPPSLYSLDLSSEVS